MPPVNFHQSLKAWERLEPYRNVTLSNREILKDSVVTLCTVINVLRPHVVHGAKPISDKLLMESVSALESNVRWLKVILERHKPKPVKPVTEEEVLPY